MCTQVAITFYTDLYYYRILPTISPLPSLTVKFYVCLDYKPPSHHVDCTCTYTHTRARTYVTPPFNWLRVQRWIFCIWWWLLEKLVLKTLCYDGTSSLAKTLMSQSRCFCFPLKTYTHRTTSPFPTADRRLLHRSSRCRSFGEKNSKLWIFPAVRDQRWCRLSTRQLQMDRDRCRFHSELVALLQYAETIPPCKRDVHKRYFECEKTWPWCYSWHLFSWCLLNSVTYLQLIGPFLKC